MRLKITFLRDHKAANSLPLHHQNLLYRALQKVCEDQPQFLESINFSSLKGTAKIQSGIMKFMSNKITLVISGLSEEAVMGIADGIFTRDYLELEEMHLMPKTKEEIPDPEFETRMKYLCISPLILCLPDRDDESCRETIDPTSREFSDILYDRMMERMENAGFSEEELDEFAVFEAQPDPDYVDKVLKHGKKYARFYESEKGETITGYLLPMTLHAHPSVHRFIWERGMGTFTNEGYGMIDVVKR